MDQRYKFVLYYLWIAPHILLLVVAALLFYRRLYKTFPIFFAYTIYETCEFLLLFSCYSLGHSLGSFYRYAYIVTSAGSAALRFGIVHEIFNNIFHDYPRLEAIASASIRWVTALLFCAATLSVIYSSGATSDNLLAGVRLLNRSVIIMQAGLLLFLFLFSKVFGLSWRSYTFGIAFGFAIYASIHIAAWTLALMTMSDRSRDLLDLVPTGSYHLCVLVWLGYLLAAEKHVPAAAYTVSEIDRWSRELERSQ